MLPFLKNRGEGAGQGPIEKLERKPDDDVPGFDMLSAVAEDILKAVEKKDHKLLKEALEALCEHVQDLDAEQDQQTMEGE
jgi:hypothetical protein